MKNVFRIEYDKARDRCKLLCDITDPKGRDIFKSAFKECTNNPNKASCRAEEANGDEGRLGTTVQQHNAAYTFLALAFVALEEGIKIPIPGKSVEHHEFFHFAGHAFRVIGQLNRAADAYWRAGVTSGRKEDCYYPDSFGIRSLAQAKIRFEDTGKVKKSDEMHYLEWEARTSRSFWCHKPILLLWGHTSKYGTSLRRWFWSLLIAIVFFTIAYQVVHCFDCIKQEQPWTFVSPLYYSIVSMTTLGYREFASNHIAAQCVIVVNVIVGYFLLAVGASILGRKVIGR